MEQVYDFIIKLGTKGDPDLLMIDNRKGKSTIYDFQLLKKNVDKVDLEVSSGIVSETPSLFVYDKNIGQSKGTLLKLRYSHSLSASNPTGRHRILVDTGDLFKTLTVVVNKAGDWFTNVTWPNRELKTGGVIIKSKATMTQPPSGNISIEVA